MTPTRRSFFGVLFAPLLTRFWPKAEPTTEKQQRDPTLYHWYKQKEAEAQRDADMAFLAGEQWDPAVRASACCASACLVFNKILPLTLRQAAKRRNEGAPLSDEEFDRLGVHYVRLHRDKKRLYNYVRSVHSEMFRLAQPLSEM